MRSWFQQLRTRFLRPQTRRTPIRRGARLGFECLEDRATPAVGIADFSAVTGAVTFNGGAGADSLVLARVETYPGSGTFVLMHNVSDVNLVSFLDLSSAPGEQTLTLGSGTDQNITVNLGGDADRLTLDGSWSFNHKITFDGGAGSDELVGNDVGKTWTITTGASGSGNVGGVGVVDFTGIEKLSAGSGADTLQGEDAARFWNLGATQTYADAASSPTLTVTFAGFDTLQGGTDVDTFSVVKSSAAHLKGGAGADVFAFKLDGSTPVLLTGNVDGGAGSDTLDYSAYVATDAVVARLTGPGSTDGFAGVEASIAGSFDNVNALTAATTEDNDADSLTGLDAAATWTVGGSETYVSGGRTLALSGINHLIGGSNVDTYNVGDDHSGNLDGQGGADLINVSGGTLTGDLIGNAGADVFTFTGGEVSGNVTGDAGDDVFAVNGAASASLSGGDGDDSFTLDAALSGAIDAGAGADVVFFTGGSVSGAVAGGADSDTLDYSAHGTAVAVDLTDAGGDAGFNGTATSTGGFTDINHVVGSALLDSLTGVDADATWEIDGTNRYVSGDNVLSFSSLEDLTGESGVDTFLVTAAHAGTLSGGAGADVFQIGATLTGSIAAGADDDVIHLNVRGLVTGEVGGGAGSNTLSYLGYGAPVHVDLSATGTAVGFKGEATATDGIDDISVLVGSTGLTDSLTGIAAAASWGIDGSNTYTSTNVLAFSGMEDLTGDSGVDTFTVTAAHHGTLTGAAGADDVTISAALTGSVLTGADGDSVTVATGGRVTGNITTDAGIDVVTVAGQVTGAVDLGDDTDGLNVSGSISGNVSGGNGDETVVISGTVTGNVDLGADSDGLTVSGSGRISGNVVLGAGVNRLTLEGTASVGGSLSGGAGSDILSYAGYSSAASVTVSGSTADGLSATASGIAGGATGLNVLTGSGSTADSLINATNAAGSFTVDADPTFDFTGNTGGALAFSAVENLVGDEAADTFIVSVAHTGSLRGADGNDEFKMNAGGSVSGNIDGDAGDDKLDYSGRASSVAINLTALGLPGFAGTATDVSGGFLDIDTVVGSSATDSLTGLHQVATWTVSDSNTYAVAGGTLVFSEVENLNGGSVQDSFEVSMDHIGNLSGNGGADLFSLYDGADLSGNISGGTGDDVVTLAGSSSAITFAGGAGRDTVSFAGADSGRTMTLAVLGTIDGYDGYEDVYLGAFSNVDVLVGSGHADTLIGRDVAATWAVAEAGNSYTSGNRALPFSAIENLTGGSDVDIYDVSVSASLNLDGKVGNDDFNLYAGTFTGTITGDAGDDDFTFAGGGVNGTVTGNAGADVFTVMAATSITGSGLLDGGADADSFHMREQLTGGISGGSGTDLLSYASYVPAVSVTLMSSSAAGYRGIGSAVTAGFDGIDTVTARSGGGDTLRGTQAASEWTLDATQTYSDGSQTLTFASFDGLVGGSAADDFAVVGDTTFAGSIDGGVGANSLSYATATRASGIDATVSAVDAGTVDELSYRNVGSLVGTGADDSFTFTVNGARLTGSVDAGEGTDLLSYSGYTAGVRVNLLSGYATGIAAGNSGFEDLTGGSGNDQLTGGTGDNVLTGGGGNDALLGDDGDDTLNGGDGHDLLIGGENADSLNGQVGNDVLIGGSTTLDNNFSALNAVMAEWGRSAVPYSTRVARLLGDATGGANGSYRLNYSTIATDGDVVDTLVGGLDDDWFLVSLEDSVTKDVAGETETETSIG